MRPNTDRPDGSDWKVSGDRNYQTASNTERQGAKIVPTREAEVWVKKWVDYSTKYGLGYYLSNEVTGVFFNDSTKIILIPMAIISTTWKEDQVTSKTWPKSTHLPSIQRNFRRK